MTAIILPHSGKGFWLSLSRGIISSFFTNTCLCIPLFPPILFSGALALALSKCWRYSTESWESEVQRWGAVVISHHTVHCMECWPCLSGGDSDTHNATIYNSAGAAVFESWWRMYWLMHCYPEPFDPSSLAHGHSFTKRHSTWIDWSKTMSTPFTHRPPEACMLTTPSHTYNTDNSCVVFSAFCLVQ